jgi:hypothetical protein
MIPRPRDPAPKEQAKSPVIEKRWYNLLGFWPFLVFPLRLCASARFILDSNAKGALSHSPWQVRQLPDAALGLGWSTWLPCSGSIPKQDSGSCHSSCTQSPLTTVGGAGRGYRPKPQARGALWTARESRHPKCRRQGSHRRRLHPRLPAMSRPAGRRWKN